MQDLVPEEGEAILDNQTVVNRGREREADEEKPQRYGAEAGDRKQKV